MRMTLYTALLAGVALPFAAFAQDSTTPPPTEEQPAVEAPADSTAPADSAAPAEGTDATTGEAPADSDAPMSLDDSSAMPDAGAAPDAGMAPDAGATPDAAQAPAEPSEAAPADASMADTASSTESTMADGPFVVVPPTGAWRVEDLDGKDVYDTAGERIGSITDVLVSEDGNVIAVLVGVGGFLGIGQKDVAVAMEALEFGPTKTEGLPKEADVAAEQQMAAETAAGGAATSVDPAAGGAVEAPAEPQTPVVGEDNLPDRIVLNVSREQLEAAPAYGEPEEAEEAAPATDAEMAPAEGEPQPAQQ